MESKWSPIVMGQHYLSSFSFHRNFKLQSIVKIIIFVRAWSIYSCTDCCGNVANRSKQSRVKPAYYYSPKMMRLRRILRCPSLLDDPLQKKTYAVSSCM